MKVLVVDDDLMQRMLLVDLLGRYERIEIVEAADGARAWEEVQNGLCPVLCCCDMLMPEMSGIELLQKFKSRTALAEVPFIFVTASTDSDTIKKAIASGATDYILKPVNFTKARSSLDRVFQDIYKRYGESPSATQKRLRVPPERLFGYYDALKQQLAGTRPTVQKQLAAGEVLPARNSLDSLKTSCNTLGLWHAAKMIECADALEPDVVDRILTVVEAAVDEQMLGATREFGVPKTRRSTKKEQPAQDGASTGDTLTAPASANTEEPSVPAPRQEQ
jgi:two-component system chemotaxis response regulator CheY